MTKPLPPMVILAGGQSARMQGFDKATVKLDGKRMIDIVIDRFQGETTSIVIAGGSDRETGLPLIEDDPNGPKGPAGALWSAAVWFSVQEMSVDGFFTVPTDTPFLPSDLLGRLTAGNRTAVASDESGLYPTIGYWRIEQLHSAFAILGSSGGLPLHRIAEHCEAMHISFSSEELFNINSRENLATSEQMLTIKKARQS